MRFLLCAACQMMSKFSNGMTMATTLRDIAEHCGVAISTVSRALRNDELVTSSTRQRIAEAARRMGYEPNVAARTLVGSRTNTVWFLVSDLMNLYQQTIGEYCSRFLAANGFDVSVVSYHNSSERYVKLLQRLCCGVTDGAIVVSASHQGEKELRLLEEKNFPLVFADRCLETASQPTVTTDNIHGTGILLEKMLQQGCRKFVLLFTDRNSVERTRLRGAVEYLGRLGVPFILGDRFDPSFFGEKEGIGILGTWQSDLQKFVRRNPPPESCSCIYGVFDTWFGDPYPARQVFVCKQDFKKIAEQSADLLLKLLRGETVPDSLYLVPPLECQLLHSSFQSVKEQK